MNIHAIGDNIKHMCKRKGLTLQILADKIGVSDCTMSNWVNGRRQITAYGLLRVSRVLDTTMERLMEGIEDEKYLPKEEPDITGDAISRQLVIDVLDETKRIARQNIDGAVLMTFERVLDSLVNIINALPIIQPKRGKWIDTGSNDEWYAREYRCSECGDTMLGEANYCHNCGAKMEVTE